MEKTLHFDCMVNGFLYFLSLLNLSLSLLCEMLRIILFDRQFKINCGKKKTRDSFSLQTLKDQCVKTLLPTTPPIVCRTYVNRFSD